jgi:sec-independent protein translocase protein TatB
MFDIGWGELVVIGIVALLVFGPKELPGVLRMLGQWMTTVRRMAADFQGQFHEAMREAEMADLKKQVDQITESAREFSHYDPLETARKEIEAAAADKPAAEATTPTVNPEPSPPSEAGASAPSPSAPAAEPAAQSEREFLGFADELDQPARPASGGGRPA